MQSNSNPSLYVAPLQIRRGSFPSTNVSESGRSIEGPYSTASEFEEGTDLSSDQSSRFQNYLRAAYPFQPTPSPSDAVTLPLKAGDIILIHSIHTNGWADGTLLESGARGWLPTNYCEPYDYTIMRPLLRALMEFWDIIRSGTDSNLSLLSDQDCIRGIVAGVRFLLEKSGCLTKESTNVKQHDDIRRLRKALLADLSVLVKMVKNLQHMMTVDKLTDDLPSILEDMLFKAFKVVSRTVRFYDIWVEEKAYSRNFSISNRSSTRHGYNILDEEDDPQSKQNNVQLRSSHHSVAPLNLTSVESLQSVPEEVGSPSLNQSVSFHRKRKSVAHRMSYAGHATSIRIPNLASETVNRAYEAFLGVLAHFLGSHIQSRSSTDLLSTTQKAVQAFKELLNVVEAVIEHDGIPVQELPAAKEAMFDSINELVSTARRVLRPPQSEDEMICLPDEVKQLGDAAMACVRNAGNCVAKTNFVLEVMGDFALSSVPKKSTVANVEKPLPASPPLSPSMAATTSFSTLVPRPSVRENALRSNLPRLDVSASRSELEMLPESNLSSPAIRNSVPSLATETTEIALRSSASQSTLQSSTGTCSPSSGGNNDPSRLSANDYHNKTDQRVSTTDSSYDSSTRDSGPSDMSLASTRATSIDCGCSHTSDQFEDHNNDDVDDVESEMLSQTYAHELIYNQDRQVIGGTLNALIEKLTAHDSTPDALYVSTFYLTFRLFATPSELATALSHRFQYVSDIPRIAGPVRLRVYNAYKTWLESHWRHDCDDSALPLIVEFARHLLTPVLGTAGARLLELAQRVAAVQTPMNSRVVAAIGKTNTSSAAYVDPDAPLPQPILSKSQLTILKAWKNGTTNIGILDFDSVELARQITLKVSALFCSILPEELLATEWTKQSHSLAVNVRAISTLSTDLTNLVSDSILQLEDPKKRAATLKQWIKIANKCLLLHNYETVTAIVSSLNSSTIARLKKTWELISPKTKATFDELKTIADPYKNFTTLRQRLQVQAPPCLPFVGMYLTDLTFVDQGNAATRQLSTEHGNLPVINLDKHMKTAKSISDLQRFQVPYRLAEVPELQTWMQDQLIRARSAGEQTFQIHYRRSLILEPREGQRVVAGTPTLGKEGSNGKDRFDFLSWTHLGRDKPMVANN